MHDPSWTREELAHLREAARVATDPIIARALRLALRHLPSEADCAWGEQAAAEVAAAIDDAVQEVKEYREANPHLRPADFQDYEEWKAKMLRSPERGE